MVCRRDIDLVAYARGEMTEKEKREMKLHVERCELCRNELAGVEKILRAIRSIDGIEPSVDFSERFRSALMEVIESEKKDLAQRGVIIILLARIRHFLTSVRRFLLLTSYRMPAWAFSAAIHIFIFAVLSYIFVHPGSFVVDRKFSAVLLPEDEVTQFASEPRDLVRFTPAAPPIERIVEDRKEIADLWSSSVSLPPEDMDLPEEIVPDMIEPLPEIPFDTVLSRKDRDFWPRIPAIPSGEWFAVNRKGERRKIAIRAYGGSDETELAVREGLEWLRAMQKEDGSWSAHETGGKSEYDIAVTSLALLAFLARGVTHQSGVDSYVVRQGIEYLKGVQLPSGLFGEEQGNYMYNQGIATLALLETYALTTDKELEKPVKSAVEFILRAQTAEGGWGYTSASLDPMTVSDTSVTGWQIMALRTASWAGLKGVEKALEKAGRWLNSVTTREGYVGYRSADEFPHGKLALTAVGMVSRFLLKLGEKDPFLPIQARFISESPPKLVKGEPYETDMYYWFHGTLGMFFHGGREWDEWNEKMKRTLLSCRSEDGSWSLTDKWSRHGGKVYVTAMAVLTLETYYRYAFRCV